jgi:PelA/Pel-15E family pectate lyase
MLDCQVVTDDERTGWCAQHDEVTLEPVLARTYELPSLSGSEAVGIVRFLMAIEEPSEEVRAAIEGAIAWFEAVKITGIRVASVSDPEQPTGEDRVVVEDPTAPPIWARFLRACYESPDLLESLRGSRVRGRSVLHAPLQPRRDRQRAARWLRLVR